MTKSGASKTLTVEKKCPGQPRRAPVVISLVPECVTGIDILTSWPNSYIAFMTCDSIASLEGL